jgi:hypothetical protein
MADVMLKVAVSTDVTNLAASVAGLCKRFECPDVVDVHRDARGEDLYITFLYLSLL